MNPDPDEYAKRNATLKQLGFASYREYLESPLWAEIRARVFRLKGSECFLCGGAATQLHHNRYRLEELTGDNLKEIKPLCRPCHEQIEFFMQQKRPIRQVKAWYHRMRRERTKMLKKRGGSKR